MKTNLKSVARLRKERAELENSPESIGLLHGQLWAETRATYPQLKRLGHWWEKFGYPAPGTQLTLCYDVAGVINPEIGRDGHRAAAEELFLQSGNTVPDGVPNYYVGNWITGAVRVLSDVEADNSEN